MSVTSVTGVLEVGDCGPSISSTPHDPGPPIPSWSVGNGPYLHYPFRPVLPFPDRHPEPWYGSLPPTGLLRPRVEEAFDGRRESPSPRPDPEPTQVPRFLVRSLGVRLLGEKGSRSARVGRGSTHGAGPRTTRRRRGRWPREPSSRSTPHSSHSSTMSKRPSRTPVLPSPICQTGTPPVLPRVG